MIYHAIALLDDPLFPEARLVFKTFSPTLASIQAVCDQISTNQLKIQE